MESKKPVYPDENSWLVSHIIRYFKSIKTHNGYTLWDELNLFFQPDKDECDYIYDATENNILYPILSYQTKNRKVILSDFEWICPLVHDLKTANFLKSNEPALDHSSSNGTKLNHESVQTISQMTNEQQMQQQPVAKPVVHKEKRGFFAWLASLFKTRSKKIETTSEQINNNATTNNHSTMTNQLAVVEKNNQQMISYHHDQMSQTTEESEINLDIDQYAAKLVDINGVDLFQAKEVLLATSYNRRASYRLFVYNLETDLELGLPILKVNFDLSFLYNSGIFNSEIGKEFKKILENKKQVELEFKIHSPEPIIDAQLEESQLIKIAA
ncbi:hypothetical protein MCAV_07810 [[Mycoplasma] cavipharyngis]|uniref:hypothetical protein n=1 Tax=[Mycoplasma] cavipharyngis TaxID=92757 RepID=UPI0037041646